MTKELDEEQQYEINEELRLECYNLGNMKDILRLIKKGADIHHLNEESMSSPLSVAASMNNVKLVEFFLKRGVSPKEHDNLALEDASNYNCLECIELLIKNGAIVKDSVFQNAYNSGNWEIVEYFVENFDIKISEEFFQRMKKDDMEFYTQVSNLVKTRQLYNEINKELPIVENIDNQKKIKI